MFTLMMSSVPTDVTPSRWCAKYSLGTPVEFSTAYLKMKSYLAESGFELNIGTIYNDETEIREYIINVDGSVWDVKKYSVMDGPKALKLAIHDNTNVYTP